MFEQRFETLNEFGGIESVDHAAGEVLKLGSEAEVLAPLELRQRMAEIAARLGAIYKTESIESLSLEGREKSLF